LESAADVELLSRTLLEFRGADGFPPVLQANTVVSAPDYATLKPPLFEVESLPLVDLPATPSRWRRPGAWDQVVRACGDGIWWPELHGLHHLPEYAWLAALRRGIADARRAHEQQSPICLATEASGEYDPAEPLQVRRRNLALAVAKFDALFGRLARSLCPPDYRWDETLESQAQSLGLSILQGKGEQVGSRFPKLRRWMVRYRWPHQEGPRFYMPLRIAFEPCKAERVATPRELDDVQRRARDAWSHGQPAVVSTHRLNYAHLDPAWSAAGRAAMRDLLKRLVDDGAVFLVDFEVRQLKERGWSVREIGDRGVLVRYSGVPREPIRFPARPGAQRLFLRENRSTNDVELSIEGGDVVARFNVGEYLIEWESP
jgi:hypothetical protein